MNGAPAGTRRRTPGRRPGRGRPTHWHLYIVRCKDGSLYTGIATDVTRRLGEHARGAGRGARYLRGRGPFELVLRRRIGRRELALRVEHAVKRLPKAGKEALLGRRDLLSRLVRRTRAGVAGFAGRRDVR